MSDQEREELSQESSEEEATSADPGATEEGEAEGEPLSGYEAEPDAEGDPLSGYKPKPLSGY